MQLRTPLSQARGLGSARDGLSHWMAQRLTAVANAVLIVWFLFSAVGLAGADYQRPRLA
ncbi:MAG: succinate dehydrogenase, hydrophobic membrane anchor protein, partial [Rhizobiales bacterium]|nr:succinate dehydrogenase, hydrophobic membrane anchor protein [Hyphomicrobiales bacterium]